MIFRGAIASLERSEICSRRYSSSDNVVYSQKSNTWLSYGHSNIDSNGNGRCVCVWGGVRVRVRRKTKAHHLGRQNP